MNKNNQKKEKPLFPFINIRGGRQALQKTFDNPQNSWLRRIKWHVKEDEYGILTLTPIGFISSEKEKAQ